MESIESQTVETTIGEMIVALREETGENKSEREKQILAAFLLSGLFGSDGLCSRAWH